MSDDGQILTIGPNMGVDLKSETKGWLEQALTDGLIRDGDSGRRGLNLQLRVFEFAVSISELADRVAGRSFTVKHIAHQMFAAASSVGAILEEADAAQSRADFISKCSISLKEARESHYWIRLLRRRVVDVDLEWHSNEANELIAILTTIIRKSRENR